MEQDMFDGAGDQKISYVHKRMSEPEDGFHIYMNMAAQSTMVLKVLRNASVEAIAETIARATGAKRIHSVILVNGGKKMEPKRSIAEYGVTNSATSFITAMGRCIRQRRGQGSIPKHRSAGTR